MAQVKISELPTLAQQLQSANYIPLIHNGITYKYAPFNYVVKNSGDETIAGVKTFSSSPIVPAGDATGEAVNYDQLTLVDQKHTVVDCSSRVAEYTGDGIPLIPDNVAGRTYFQDEWATVDGWTPWLVGQGSLSVLNGSLRNTSIAGSVQSFYKSVSLSSGMAISLLIRSSKEQLMYVVLYNGSTYTTIGSFTVKGHKQLFSFTVGSPNTHIIIRTVNNSESSGDLVEIDTIYIGTGAYDTPALDRSGNGNSLALTAVTPVNGKFGKEMSFNGATSFAQASSPVIGTTGTVAVRFKVADTTNAFVLFDTRHATTSAYGLALLVSAGVLAIRFSGAIQQNFNLSSGIGAGFRTAIISFDATNIYFYFDGALISTTPITVAGFSHTNNLMIGRGQSSATPGYLNGTISHFRYDSRIWTADEARAWSLNPSVEDSISMSETPSDGDIMVWPENGLSFKDFIITSPAAGGIANVAHGLTTTKIRTIDAALVNASGAVIPKGYFNTDGSRTAHFEVNCNSTNVYVLSDTTLAATWIGQPVYIRLGYAP